MYGPQDLYQVAAFSVCLSFSSASSLVYMFCLLYREREIHIHKHTQALLIFARLLSRLYTRYASLIFVFRRLLIRRGRLAAAVACCIAIAYKYDVL